MYMKGSGVAKNWVLAVEYFERYLETRKGEPMAYYNLGVLLFKLCYMMGMYGLKKYMKKAQKNIY